MRTLNELHSILYNEIKDRVYISGLCFEINRLCDLNKITDNEYKKLYKHFKKNKPNKKLHSKFLKSDTWVGGTYWWTDKENNDPVNRIRFIEEMVKITKR